MSCLGATGATCIGGNGEAPRTPCNVVAGAPGADGTLSGEILTLTWPPLSAGEFMRVMYRSVGEDHYTTVLLDHNTNTLDVYYSNTIIQMRIEYPTGDCTAFESVSPESSKFLITDDNEKLITDYGDYLIYK